MYESIHRTFWKRQVYRDRKQISACQGLRVLGGIDYKGSIRISRSDGILLHLLKKVNVIVNKLYLNF